jgi:hypothetical protein
MAWNCAMMAQRFGLASAAVAAMVAAESGQVEKEAGRE